MDKELVPTIAAVGHGNDAAATVTSVQDADYATVHEGISLHELQQMRFYMHANGTVRLDHCTGLGIDVVPRSAHLRLQPAAQGAEQIRQSLAAIMRTFDALELWQMFIGQVGSPSIFTFAGIPTW